MTISVLLGRYGLPIVFLAGGIEAETIVIGAGLLAHEGVLDPIAVMVAAGSGSLIANQLLFLLGRLSGRRPLVQALLRRPSVSQVLRLLERHPMRFILGFRFLYGLRLISPIAIGTTHVPVRRFAIVNLVGAVVWSVLFTGLGYAFGHGIEKLFGEVSKAGKIVALLVFLGLFALVLRQVRARYRR